MKKNFTIRVFGKVQGVWFRDSTQKKAKELSIFGWVKNESDGTVLIEAEGIEEDLKQFFAWCEEGPEMAKVGRVEISEGEVQNLEDFKVIY